MIQLGIRLLERNAVRKNWRKVRLRVALCYPNAYRAGMTSLAVHLLYHLFNERQEVACERVFYVPGETPRSLESGQPLHHFDVVAFSLQFETDYARAVEMLVRSGIPPLSSHRRRPLVIAGGPCATENPLPMQPFIDAFLIGELEPVFDQLLNALLEAKSAEDLETLLGPTFLLASSSRAERSVVWDLDAAPHPVCQVSPQSPLPPSLEPVFGRSLLVEVSRGCDRRCNFCLTSYQGGPRRERSLSNLMGIISDGVRCTGVDKVALIASGLSDYSKLGELLEFTVGQGLHLSVPSIRADLPDPSIIKFIAQGGQRTLTLAPEAGSSRLRRLLAKPIPDDAYMQTVAEAISSGINLFKLYFLTGIPTESDEDMEAIKHFCHSLLQLPPRKHRLHVSVNPLIPKPHTPFQWLGLAPLRLLRQRLAALRLLLHHNRIILDLPNPRWSVIQAALSRGTSSLAPLILAVAREGRQTLGSWFHAARSLHIDLEGCATTSLLPDEPLPWEHLEVGVKRNTLLSRYRKVTQQ